MSETTAIEKASPANGTIQRQEFGAQQVQRQAETATAAVAAQAKAEVEARYVMALQRPRDFDEVRARFLKECRRPSFAKVARYSKPVGGQKIEGPSIRFVEAAIRAMGNIMAPTSVIYEDRERRIIRVSVTDLESNVTIPTDLVIEKTVERQKSEGRIVLAERTNSYGKTVYIVVATEDELLVKQAALVSKAIRTNGLRLLPGDLIEEGQDECVATLRDRAAKDPEAEKKAILDAFGEIGIPPGELKAYLGHSLDTLVPAELVELRQVYAAIKDGEATWKETMEAKASASMASSGAPPAPGAAPSAAQQLVDQVQAQQGQPAPGPAVDRGLLGPFADALAAAKSGKDLIAAMKLVKDLPGDLQEKARAMYNARQEEIAKEISGG